MEVQPSTLLTNLVVVAERIEQAIKIGIVNSKIMIEFELGNGWGMGLRLRIWFD